MSNHDELVEKMAKLTINDDTEEHYKRAVREMCNKKLQIVLSAIERGEVVGLCHGDKNGFYHHAGEGFMDCQICHGTGIVLKQGMKDICNLKKTA